MHSFAGLDEGRDALMDMADLADSRSAAIVREMKKDEALCRSFYERTGLPHPRLLSPGQDHLAAPESAGTLPPDALCGLAEGLFILSFDWPMGHR